MDKVIYNLTEQEREIYLEQVLKKYTTSENVNQRKTKWKDKDFVTKVIKKHIQYLTIERNVGIVNEENIITEKDAFKYLNLYNTKNRPNIDKLELVLQTLDGGENIGKENANKIFKEFGKIVQSDVEKLLLKIKIINRFNYMERVLENPRKFIISPEYMYARLAYYTEKNGNISNISASRILSDKDEYTKGNQKRITDVRKNELINKYVLPNFDDEDSKGER